MRVPIEIVRARRERVARLLRENRYLGVRDLCARLDISEATARRDLAALAEAKRITRTHGGALADFNLRFPSFQQRLTLAAAGKRWIAEEAVVQVRAGMTVYLDAGTTIYMLARLLLERDIRPLTVVTASLPVADLLADGDGIKVILVGGEFLRRQSVLVGKTTWRTLGGFAYDLAAMSVEGVNAAGLWNTQAEITRAQRTVLRRARRVLVCVDAAKLGRSAPIFLAKWSDRLTLITDAADRSLVKSS
ncbi:MAG: DeoR/GlpR family DNA-binding transcription regulator [Verrucomicrobiales bacterium]|jgi:DeoR/GlpR family transcriptional regulator of sugar metabolism|nr:DeoR/GlpR family DNA-binding transcription regulator [Verrucomicrobiales bacterium]